MNQVDKYLQAHVGKNRTPGITYHFFDSNRIIYQFKSGWADIGKNYTVNNDTTFNGFSVTKTFTALAILQLAEHRRLDTQHAAKKYLPDFPFDPAITIHQLLTHSSGIPNPIPLNWIHLIADHPSFDRNLFFKKVLAKHNKTSFPLNEKFAYSNLGYYLLGRIIENVSGLEYEEYVRTNIIRTLELRPDELGFIIQDISKHAKGYIKHYSFSNLIIGFFIDKAKYMSKVEGSWKSFNNYYINGTSYGGLIGTSNAFVRYIQELLMTDCKLLSGHSKRQLFTENFTNENKSTGMCASWFSGKLKDTQYFSHAGGGGGYYCEIRIYPGICRGSVIMFNRTGIKDERFLNNVDKFFIEDGNH